MSDNVNRIAVVGLGNVGYWTTIGLCQAMLVNPAVEWDIAVVDYDRVDDRAVRKGYAPWLIGVYKPKAIVAAIEAEHGVRIASSMHPVTAAAQSVPGLFADRDLFICVDSLDDALFVSNRGRARWQCRVSTGTGDLAAHCVEVFPPDTATLGDVYDDRAYAQGDRRQSCVTGEPARPLDGAAHPLGIVAGALAIQAYLHRATDTTAYRLQLTGTQPIRSDLVLGQARQAEPCRSLRLDNRATVDEVWQEIARDLEVAADRLMLRWEVPLVWRRCSCPTSYFGFERYPVTGRCPKCHATSVLVMRRHDMPPGEAHENRRRTLRWLHAPAGIGLAAITGDNRSQMYRLSYRHDDVPQLTEEASSHPFTHQTEGLQA